MYSTSKRPALLGDDVAKPAPQTSLYDVINGPTVSTASGIALIFHGYKRTHSIVWALLYGLAGRTLPAVAVPVAIAQGFGKRKTCDP